MIELVRIEMTAVEGRLSLVHLSGVDPVDIEVRYPPDSDPELNVTVRADEYHDLAWYLLWEGVSFRSVPLTP